MNENILDLIVNELRNKWFNILNYGNITEDRKSSFWYYNEEILRFSKSDQEYVIDTNGEINIYLHNQWIVFNNWKTYNNWLPFDINKWNDDDLLKMIELWYEFTNINWFSLYNIKNPNNDYLLDDWFTIGDILKWVRLINK
jgi:hypothetical protein